jgi:hypothetical protein
MSLTRTLMLLAITLGGCSFNGNVDANVQCTSSCDDEKTTCYDDCDTSCTEDDPDDCVTTCQHECDTTYDDCTVSCSGSSD